MCMAATPARVQRPWYHPFALVRRLVLYSLIGYVVICVYLFSIQTSLTYAEFDHPLSMGEATEQAKASGLEPWAQGYIKYPGNELEAPPLSGYVRPDFIKPSPRGTIVVFHGNGGAAFDRGNYAEAFARRGFRTFLYEYPGYGGRPGRPSEASIVPDAQALVRSLDQEGYGPVYVWGESLGAGVAAAVCAEASLPIHGVVLLTPWDNIANVGQSFYPWFPVRLLMIDKYDSVANLQKFAHPICVVRSDQDEVIPPPLSLNLFAHLPEPKKMIVHQDSGHNSWPSSPELPWWDEALDFIAPRQVSSLQP